MLRVREDSWVRVPRTVAWLVTSAALCAAGLATPDAHAGAWRAFSPESPWNRPAARESIGYVNPYASQFAHSPGFTMKIAGTPENPRFASPVYFAQPGDPLAPVKLGKTGWSPAGSLRWNGRPIPAPAGVAPAPGSDGHLVVVSADRRTAWEFWRCTAAGPLGYKTEVIAQWDLTGLGYAPEGDRNSARGSGTPLVSTALRAEEALYGIDHALGFTVPSVSNDYLFPPATHSDGDGSRGSIKYGMLFVLRPDYRLPWDAPIGVRNVVRALKEYGAYVVDQGADFEIDADSTHPELWAQTGLKYSPFDFTAADLRPARPGPPGWPPPYEELFATVPVATTKSVTLGVAKRRVRPGARLRVRGRVTGPGSHAAEVRVKVHVRGAWRLLVTTLVGPDGRFAAGPLAPSGRRVHGVRLRAVAKGFGRSKLVRVRIARPQRRR